MSDQDSPAVFETIVRIIHLQSADGALRSEIESQLPSDDERDQLTRRLVLLERFGWITRTGRGQNTRYLVTPMALASLARNDPPPAPPNAAPPSAGGAATDAAAPAPVPTAGSAPLSAAAPPADSTPTAPAPVPARVDLEPLKREAIGFLVGVAGLPTSQARAMVQRYANANDLSEADAITFEEQVMSELTSLTEEEAWTKYRIDAAHFATWREHCAWADGTHAKPPRPSAGDVRPEADATPKPYPERTQGAALRSTQSVPQETTKRTPSRAQDPEPAEKARAQGGRSGEHGGAQLTTRGEATKDAPGRSEETADEDEGAAAQGPLARLSPTWIAVGVAAIVVLGIVGARWGGTAAGVVTAMLAPLGGLAAIWPRVRRATAEAAGAATNGKPAAAGARSGPLDILSAIPPRTRYALVGGVLAAIALVVAVTWWLQVRTLPPEDQVSAYLVKSVAPLPVRVATLAVTPGADSAMGRTLSYQVRFETTEPLYDRVDTTKYLKEHAAADLAVIDKAEALLKGANGERLRAMLAGDAASAGDAKKTAGAGDARPTSINPAGSSADPVLHPIRDLVLVTKATAAGATGVTSGQIVAWKQDGGWTFNGAVRVDGLNFSGKPKPAGAFPVDTPADEARFQSVISEQVSFAARVQAAVTELAAEAERQRQQRIARFGELLRGGTVFTGTASSGNAGAAVRMTLEVASSSPTPSHVTALARNDGGWADARLFQGEWSVPAEGDACTLTLRSTRDDRVLGGGPLLDDNREIDVTLQVRLDGTVSGAPDNWQLRRVEPAAVAALQAGISRALPAAVAATKPGLLYRGTVTAQGRNTSEILMLRFDAQEPDGTRLEASLRSASVAAWVRAFRGSVVDNFYRVGSSPIRLQSRDADRIPQAPVSSMLGLANPSEGVSLNLRVEAAPPAAGATASAAKPGVSGDAAAKPGPRLVGQDDRFTYVFEPVDPAWTPPASTVVPNAGDASAAGMLRALPPFPGEVGAYVLSDDGKWVPLPRNNSHIVQSTVQKANAFLSWLTKTEAKIAGTASPDESAVTGQWMFDNNAPVPVVAGEDVVVIYAGPLLVSQAMLAKYPQLALEPVIEMAPLWTLDSGVRSVPLTSPVKGTFGFGPLRVPATIERPALSITLLHVTTKLPARRYAIGAGDYGYEVEAR